MVKHLEEFLADRRRRAIAVGTAAFVLVCGVAVVAYALAGVGDVAPAQVQEAVTIVPTTSPSPSPTPSPSPSPSPTPQPTPEPTPQPYDGAVARLAVPRLGINNYIEPVPIIANQMQAPSDGVYAIGWYYDYPKPGWGENALFSAHETWNLSRGPFYALHLAVPGDRIIVTMDNGIQYSYEVISNVRYDESTIPMGEVVWPSNRPPGEEWITLITCGGRIVYYGNSRFGEYLDRDVVQARRIE